MSTSTSAPPPKGRKNKQRATDEPDPNANRASNYLTKWEIEHNKQTAKCKLCSHSLAGTKWCVKCVKCRTRICSPCWKGERINKFDEAIFEGKVQNEEGCWTCKFGPGVSDPKWRPQLEERNVRMKEKIATASLAASKATGDEPEPKPQEIEHDVEEKYGLQQEANGIPIVAKKRKIEQYDDKESFATSCERGRQLKRKALARHQLVESGAATLRASHEPHRNVVPVKHLQDKTTVIIGAGVVGLTIARELALAIHNTSTEHEIIVVDYKDGYAQGASADCAGLIIKHGVPQEYKPLLELGLQGWKEILESSTMKRDNPSRHLPQGVIHVKAESDQESSVELPSTYNSRPEDTYRKHAIDVGKISTPSLHKWLYKQCQELGVQFRFGQEVPRITKTKGLINEVDIWKTDDHTREVTIPCHNIIIAAGSQTPDVLNFLTPWSNRLENFNEQHFDWVSHEDVLLSDADSDKPEMITRSVDGTYSSIIVPESTSQEILVGSVHDAHYARPQVNRAELLASNRLSGAGKENVTKRRSTLVSTSYNNRPLVDKVPPVLIDQRFPKAQGTPLGIYVAYGFGKFGTTLAPGVATAVCRMVMGDDSGIGDSFRYPTPEQDYLPGF